MWYVMQVATGREHRIKAQCETRIPGDVLGRCFIPMYESKKKRDGRWNVEERILFPGYVFVVTEDIIKLRTLLKDVDGLTRVLGCGDEMVPLADSEVAFLERFMDEEDIVRMSEGIIENSRVIIQQGPMMGLEGYITKIDRHKRKAYLEMELFGRTQKVEVGLEIVRKM